MEGGKGGNMVAYPVSVLPTGRRPPGKLLEPNHEENKWVRVSLDPKLSLKCGTDEIPVYFLKHN